MKACVKVWIRNRKYTLTTKQKQESGAGEQTRHLKSWKAIINIKAENIYDHNTEKQKKSNICLFVQPQDYTDYARYMLFTSRYSATATQRTVVLEVVKLRAAKCMATEKKNYLTLILQRSYQVK